MRAPDFSKPDPFSPSVQPDPDMIRRVQGGMAADRARRAAGGIAAKSAVESTFADTQGAARAEVSGEPLTDQELLDASHRLGFALSREAEEDREKREATKGDSNAMYRIGEIAGGVTTGYGNDDEYKKAGVDVRSRLENLAHYFQTGREVNLRLDRQHLGSGTSYGPHYQFARAVQYLDEMQADPAAIRTQVIQPNPSDIIMPDFLNVPPTAAK
jgi:hypothetical protein